MALLSIIVAASENGIIGAGGTMPWHLPEDLKYFRQITVGKPVIMGRKTYESIGKALPKRRNIVVTRNADWTAEGVDVASSLEQAVDMAREADEIMIIGGGEIYKQALPLADRIYLTRIHASIVGDTRFPSLDKSEWTEVTRKEHAAKNSSPAYSFIVLERAQGSPPQ